jgi:hypothetical protein
VRGLNEFPPERLPDNIPLLYYSYHIMIGLGTILIGVMALASLSLWRGSLYRAHPLLWLLMLMLPFPYIATTAGWTTAEVGRQPWLIYGINRRTHQSLLLRCSGFDWVALIDPIFGEIGLDEHGLYAGETHLLQQLDGRLHVGAIAPRAASTIENDLAVSRELAGSHS